MVTNENSNNYTCLLSKVSQFRILEPFMRLLTKLRWRRHVFARNLASIKDSFFVISGKFITLSVMLFHWRCQILGSLASRSHGWQPIFSSCS